MILNSNLYYIVLIHHLLLHHHRLIDIEINLLILFLNFVLISHHFYLNKFQVYDQISNEYKNHYYFDLLLLIFYFLFLIYQMRNLVAVILILLIFHHLYPIWMRLIIFQLFYILDDYYYHLDYQILQYFLSRMYIEIQFRRH